MSELNFKAQSSCAVSFSYIYVGSKGFLVLKNEMVSLKCVLRFWKESTRHKNTISKFSLLLLWTQGSNSITNCFFPAFAFFFFFAAYPTQILYFGFENPPFKNFLVKITDILIKLVIRMTRIPERETILPAPVFKQ